MHRAAIYARISDDREGRALGVARQEKDCRERAERDGLNVVAVFVDNDLGASEHSRKPRPEYERMLEMIEAGEVEVILAYSNSRLTRRPRELDHLIRLHKRTRVQFRTVVSGDDDLSTADGRLMARVKADFDAAEAERTAERVSRVKADHAAAGRSNGGRRPYGWRPDRVTLDPHEHAIIEECVERLLAGESLRGVTADLTARGVPTASWRPPLALVPWRPTALRDMLTSPRMAGFRTHHGQVVATGTWQPALSEATWREIRQLLTEPSRLAAPKRAARVNLLTGLARCGECDRLVGIRYVSGRQTGLLVRYHCEPCGLYRSAPPIDRYVEGAAIEFLEHAGDSPAPGVDASQVAKVEQMRTRIAETLTEFKDDASMTPAQLRQLMRSMNADLAAEEARLTPPRRRRLQKDLAGPGAAERWKALTLDQKRANIADLFEVRILRAPTGGQPFDEETVDLVRR